MQAKIVNLCEFQRLFLPYPKYRGHLLENRKGIGNVDVCSTCGGGGAGVG